MVIHEAHLHPSTEPIFRNEEPRNTLNTRKDQDRSVPFFFRVFSVFRGRAFPFLGLTAHVTLTRRS